jgi:Zn-dependent peptidase ImmA (M78 family)
MRKYTGTALREKSQQIISTYKGLFIADILNVLAKKYGFSKTEFTPSENSNHIKGAVISNEKGKNIYIKADMADSEKLFVFAHEVAHILLHSGKDHMDFIAKPRDAEPERSDTETEANILAYELIFPLDKFIELYKENNGDIESLAYCFNTSVYRTKERINFLKKQIALKQINDFIGV